MSGKMPFEGKKQPFLRVLGKFLVSEFSVKNKSDISEHKKKPRKPAFSGLFWAERTGFEPAEAVNLARFPSVCLKPLDHLSIGFS